MGKCRLLKHFDVSARLIFQRTLIGVIGVCKGDFGGRLTKDSTSSGTYYRCLKNYFIDFTVKLIKDTNKSYWSL